MAERVPQPTDEARILDSSPDRPSATSYVVQVPKDQIYRIPPPENFAIAHSRRPENSTLNPGHRKTRLPRKCCFCSCFCVVVILVPVLVLACHVLMTYLYPPKIPLFHVERLAGTRSRRDYSVRLRVENPNARVDFEYGAAAMSLRAGKGVSEVTEGKFPAFRHKHGRSAVVEIVLRGSGGGGREAQPIVRLEISHVAARTEVWTWRTGIVEFDVVCDVTMDSLRGGRVLSQDCRTTKRGIHRSL